MSERWMSALLSLLVPGAGQLAQGRRVAGIAFLAAALTMALVLAFAESLRLPGMVPFLGLLVVLVWAPLDAWRHAPR